MEQDPGWRPALVGLVPFHSFPLRRRRLARPNVSAIILLRQIFLAFAQAIVLIGVVVVILANAGNLEHQQDARWVALGIGAVGIITQVLARVLAGSLDATNPTTLVATYQTRFFLRVAFSESAAMVGFVGFILTANPWLYLLGAAFAALGFAWLAPTRGHLAHDEQQLRARGSGTSLVEALAAPPGVSPGGRA